MAKRFSAHVVVGLIGLAVACSSERSAQREESPVTVRKGGKRGEWMELRDLMKLLEESERAYIIGGLDKLTDIPADRLEEAQWPQAVQPIAFPSMKEGGQGPGGLDAYPMDQACLDALEGVEPLYKEKEYAAAREKYAAIQTQFPGCYLATVYLGDAHLFDGKPEEAERLYAEVIKANPSDHRGYFFRASALNAMGRSQEAAEHYAWALTLKPRYESVLQAVHHNEDRLGANLHDQPFRIHGIARKTKDGIEVLFDKDRPYWLAFAVVKAAWLGEPEVRRRMGVQGSRGWTSDEERHALLSTLAHYIVLREEKKAEEDPEMERLRAVAEAKLLDGFILYEIASRIHPHIIVTVPREVQEVVHAYVMRFVLGVRVPPKVEVSL